MVYAEAVKYYPDDVALRVNLGSVLLETDHPAEARSHYEKALAIDPEFPQAHGGMYYALTRLGEADRARLHQEKAFTANALFPSPYRGDGEPIPVLLLVSSTGGNTPIEKLVDERIFQILCGSHGLLRYQDAAAAASAGHQRHWRLRRRPGRPCGRPSRC